MLESLVDDSAFSLLTCPDDPAVSLVVARPWDFFPEYSLELDAEQEAELALETPDDAVVFCAVSIDREARRLFVNLRAPFVVHGRSREGRQVILGDEHPLRAAVAMEAG